MKYCGRYFVVTHNLDVYCNRVVDGTRKTCKELGLGKYSQKKAQNEQAIKLYYREYKKRYDYYVYHDLSKIPFFRWAKTAKDVRDKCLSGIVTLEDFSQWLADSYKY